MRFSLLVIVLLLVSCDKPRRYEACGGAADCKVCTNCARCKWCKQHPQQPCGIKKARAAHE